MTLLSLSVLLISLVFAKGQQPSQCTEAFSAIFTTLFFGSDCVETKGGVCPDSCRSTLSEIHETCAGKTYRGDDGQLVDYGPSSTLGFSFFVHGACEGMPLSILMDRNDLECSDWLDISAYSAAIICSQETECTESCTRIIDKVYDSCAATSTRTDVNVTGGVITAEDMEIGISYFRHDECNEYADGLEWRGGVVTSTVSSSSPLSTSSPTGMPSSRAVTSLPTVWPSASPTMVATSVPTLSQLQEAPSTDFSPKEVVTVETSHKAYGSISMPGGSPWCNGDPTYWLVGHERKEAPWCYRNGSWVRPRDNLMKDPTDRHDCATLDVNMDGILDVMCGVGAVSGTDIGFNEVFITNPDDMSLTKAAQGHGLDKYTTMRDRFMKTLRGADGSDLVFLATKGIPRQDGRENNHRMFRLTHPTDETFHFEELAGRRPWTRYTEASCVEIADVNQDGLDDIILCNRKARGMMFVQKPDGGWETVIFKGGYSYDWRNVRVADITSDGILDLIVVGYGGIHRSKPKSFIRIFKGMAEAPYFDLSREGFFYGRSLPYASPDLELLDVNQDGKHDIYVVQVDQVTPDSYCSPRFKKSDWWRGSYSNFVPPRDNAPDLLFIQTPGLRRQFKPVNMTHSEPGCGHFVETFGDNRTMILAQGFRDRPGHNLLIKW